MWFNLLGVSYKSHKAPSMQQINLETKFVQRYNHAPRPAKSELMINLDLLQRMNKKFLNFNSSAEEIKLCELDQSKQTTITKVKPFTMLSEARLLNNLVSVEHIVNNSVPGDIVECGVWRGGSTMAVALHLMALGEATRQLWLYDTFSGMPKPGALDTKGKANDAITKFEKLATSNDTSNWCYASEAEVRANVIATNYGEEKIHLVPGKVENSILISCQAKFLCSD